MIIRFPSFRRLPNSFCGRSVGVSAWRPAFLNSEIIESTVTFVSFFSYFDSVGVFALLLLHAVKEVRDKHNAPIINVFFKIAPPYIVKFASI